MRRIIGPAKQAIKDIIKALRPMNETQLAIEEMATTLGYHERMNRCMPHPHEGEVVKGATPAILVEQYEGERKQFRAFITPKYVKIAQLMETAGE